MKRSFITFLLAITVSSLYAATFWSNGVKYSNICRNGKVFTVYPVEMSHPIGQRCPIRERYDGPDIGIGIVSDE